jgi:VanZ family protein
VVNIVYAVALAGVSMMSAPPWVPILSQTDWLAHGLAYMMQTLLLYWLFLPMTAPSRAIVAAAGTAALFGTVMEVVQLVMPGRFFEVQDLFANGVGIGVGVVLLVGFRMSPLARPEDASR